ncbi:hepatic lectin-like [Boleophthalmus pectinirostris]|uniref:hepatic lectin-like n=1 Tax=Boleophthalmus pectinirostris TaxID=150288 RepID=UPI0024315146|nr:hepatic lectin-like [Boleophthalmus pectinirostris]
MHENHISYVNVPERGAPHTGARSGRRVKVTVLRVAVVMAAVLIVAYVFDGIALFLNAKKCTDRVETSTNATTAKPAVTTSPPPPPAASSDPPPTTCAVKLSCGTNWELHGGKCYYFATTRSTWSHSRTLCQRSGGDLVKIDSREEQWFLYSKVKDLTRINGNRFWIGLTDSQTEGVWKWVDGSSLDPSLTFWYTSTYSSEPDNGRGIYYQPEGEDCVWMGETWLDDQRCWMDQNCNVPNLSICEMEPTQTEDCL